MFVPFSYDCQLQNGPLHHKDVGTGTGEICEIINSKVSELRNITKYQAPVNRDARIEHACAEIK
jgi:hypothetical protein